MKLERNGNEEQGKTNQRRAMRGERELRRTGRENIMKEKQTSGAGCWNEEEENRRRRSG